jgi:hypothetical protein
MPNPIRYLLGRLRGAVDDRRRAPRYNVRVSFSISILDETADDKNRQPPLTLVGRTRNVSASGLALIVPSLSLGTGHLDDGNSTLQLILDLPGGRVEVQVTPVRSHPLDGADGEGGYFIGVKITHLSEDALARYTGFLRKLRSPH